MPPEFDSTGSTFEVRETLRIDFNPVRVCTQSPVGVSQYTTQSRAPW